MSMKLKQPTMWLATLFCFFVNLVMRWNGHVFSHPPKRRRVTYASTIRPASASASTLSTSSMKPLHGIISYRTCILV